MKEVNVGVSGLDVDYKVASVIANAIAQQQLDHEAVVVAWHDRARSRMSPVIEGADIHTRWRDYGESHGGSLKIGVNGDYDFIFASSDEYEKAEGPGPYVTVRDKQGNEYLCVLSALKDPSNPSEAACYKMEESMGSFVGG
jgi:uncharacterized protein DUF5619